MNRMCVSLGTKSFPLINFSSAQNMPLSFKVFGSEPRFSPHCIAPPQPLHHLINFQGKTCWPVGSLFIQLLSVLLLRNMKYCRIVFHWFLCLMFLVNRTKTRPKIRKYENTLWASEVLCIRWRFQEMLFIMMLLFARTHSVVLTGDT